MTITENIFYKLEKKGISLVLFEVYKFVMDVDL